MSILFNTWSVQIRTAGKQFFLASSAPSVGVPDLSSLFGSLEESLHSCRLVWPTRTSFSILSHVFFLSKWLFQRRGADTDCCFDYSRRYKKKNNLLDETASLQRKIDHPLPILVWGTPWFLTLKCWQPIHILQACLCVLLGFKKNIFWN